MALYDHVLARLPGAPAIEDQDAVALVLAQAGAAMVREGRAAEGLPLLQRAETGYGLAQRGHRMPFVHRMLAEAWEAVARPDEAARQYALLAESLADEPPESAARVAARERHARFLLAQGDVATAETWFGGIVDTTRDGAPLAMAHAGLARIALDRGDVQAAIESSAQALAVLARVEGGLDVRVAPALWLVRAEALAAAGRIDDARSAAEAALAAFRRYDHPQSPRLREAETLLAALPAP